MNFLSVQLVDLVMGDCLFLRGFLTSKQHHIKLFQNSVRLLQVNAFHTNALNDKLYKLDKQSSGSLAKYYLTNRTYYFANTFFNQHSFGDRYFHCLSSMGLVSGKCHDDICACCSLKLSYCRCNCEKSTRCYCAGPRHFHRIGINQQIRKFSTTQAKMDKELRGLNLLREPNVNKVRSKLFFF